jgi:hypothetical protein
MNRRREKAMAGTMRSVLIDIFRQRLILETYGPVRAAADTLPPWLPLALVTTQRREDIANMRFTNIYDDRLHVTQIKTGAMISIPLSLSLNGIRPSAIIHRCCLLSTSDFLISAGKRKNNPDGSIHLDRLKKSFVKARNLSGVEFSDHPPLFS